MAQEFSIGVVTYLGRFESYFKPLMRELHFLFPDREINVWINGHHDKTRQIRYLKEITTFLNKYSQVRYLTNLDHQPLANGFNRLILLSRSDRILILNDDLKLYFNFRHNFESRQYPQEIFTLNGTWSHFVISKDVIKKVGWFDERFLEIGYEDTDYVIRLALGGVPLGDLKIHGLHDCMAPPEDASWADLSELTLGKYSIINWDFFQKKWGVISGGAGDVNGAMLIRAVGAEWRLKPDAALQKVPEFYPLQCLEHSAGHQPGLVEFMHGRFAKALSLLSSLYWRARLVMGAGGRKLLGPRWEHLRQRLGR